MGCLCFLQMELQAASLVFAVNIVVHQAGQPAWSIRNFPKVRMLQASRQLPQTRPTDASCEYLMRRKGVHAG